MNNSKVVLTEPPHKRTNAAARNNTTKLLLTAQVLARRGFTFNIASLLQYDPATTRFSLAITSRLLRATLVRC